MKVKKSATGFITGPYIYIYIQHYTFVFIIHDLGLVDLGFRRGPLRSDGFSRVGPLCL